MFLELPVQFWGRDEDRGQELIEPCIRLPDSRLIDPEGS
jgi:hypothetical protein